MWIYFELPNTDALGMALSLDGMTERLKEFGNPPVRWNAKEQIFEVPAFKESRNRFIQGKLDSIKKNGGT